MAPAAPASNDQPMPGMLFQDPGSLKVPVSIIGTITAMAK